MLGWPDGVGFHPGIVASSALLLPGYKQVSCRPQRPITIAHMLIENIRQPWFPPCTVLCGQWAVQILTSPLSWNSRHAAVSGIHPVIVNTLFHFLYWQMVFCIGAHSSQAHYLGSRSIEGMSCLSSFDHKASFRFQLRLVGFLKWVFIGLGWLYAPVPEPPSLPASLPDLLAFCQVDRGMCGIPPAPSLPSDKHSRTMAWLWVGG